MTTEAAEISSWGQLLNRESAERHQDPEYLDNFVGRKWCRPELKSLSCELGES